MNALKSMFSNFFKLYLRKILFLFVVLGVKAFTTK